MTSEEYKAETYLLTIKAALEREQARNADAWANICYPVQFKERTRSGLKYFEPAYPTKLDEFGQPITY
jgi:hypothetical protein